MESNSCPHVGIVTGELAGPLPDPGPLPIPVSESGTSLGALAAPRQDPDEVRRRIRDAIIAVVENFTPFTVDPVAFDAGMARDAQAGEAPQDPPGGEDDSGNGGECSCGCGAGEEEQNHMIVGDPDNGFYHGGNGWTYIFHGSCMHSYEDCPHGGDPGGCPGDDDRTCCDLDIVVIRERDRLLIGLGGHKRGREFDLFWRFGRAAGRDPHVDDGSETQDEGTGPTVEPSPAPITEGRAVQDRGVPERGPQESIAPVRPVQASGPPDPEEESIPDQEGKQEFTTHIFILPDGSEVYGAGGPGPFPEPIPDGPDDLDGDEFCTDVFILPNGEMVFVRADLGLGVREQPPVSVSADAVNAGRTFLIWVSVDPSRDPMPDSGPASGETAARTSARPELSRLLAEVPSATVSVLAQAEGIARRTGADAGVTATDVAGRAQSALAGIGADGAGIGTTAPIDVRAAASAANATTTSHAAASTARAAPR